MIVNSAISSHRAGKLAEAGSLYKSVLSGKPHQIESLHFLGLIEAQRGNLVEADRLLAQSTKGQFTTRGGSHQPRTRAHQSQARRGCARLLRQGACAAALLCGCDDSSWQCAGVPLAA